MSSAYLLAFVVGLMSALHCLGMCGGIIGALSYSLPAEVRNQSHRLTAFLVAYNLGRVGSYAAAGALFGWLGAALMADGERAWIYGGLRWLAAVVVVGIGLYIGGWFPRFAFIERIGMPLWRVIEPWGRRLMPVRSLHRALLYGAIWGWLPCGLVYSMLIGAPALGAPGAGALYMALFGLGTVPVSLAAGLLAGRLYRLGQDRRFQAAAGLSVILLGLFALGF